MYLRIGDFFVVHEPVPDLFAPFDIGKERADIRLGVVIVLWIG